MVFELRVVDDTAERGVALNQEYNDLLTKDEGQLNLLFLSSRNTAGCTTIATMLTVRQGLASASYHTAGTGLKEQNGSVL